MDSRKKILYIITKSNFGGAQRYVYDVATSLPREEFDVAVACGLSADTVGGDGAFLSMLREKNIPILPIKSFQRDINFVKEFFSMFELWRLYRTVRPDVVHLNSSKAGGMGAFVARCARVPKIIFTAHGWPFWEPRNILQKALIYFFSWLTVVLSHTTICISQSDANIGRRMPLCKNKIRLVRNGIAPYKLLPRDAARATLCDAETITAHENDVWVLTNAELNRNKNLFTGIDAILMHNATSQKKIFYTIMGDGELRDRLIQYMTEKNAEHQVHMLGFVPNGRLYYGGFDVFFLPSLKEGVPYVLLEAGVASLPCVASNVGGIPEIIENGKNGFVETPYDAKAFSRALTKLAENHQWQKEMGEHLHHKVTESFSLTEMCSQTIACYR